MARQHKEQARAKTVRQFEILDLAKQRYIWTTEHITFEVETHLGQRFTTALQEKDPSTLSTMFRDDFEGQIPHELTWTSRQHGLVTEQNQSINSLSCRHVDAKKNAKHLLQAVDRFQSIQRCQLRVLQIDQVDYGSSSWKVKILLLAHGRDHDGQWTDWESEHEWNFLCANDQEIANREIIHRWNVLNETFRTCPRPFLE